MVKYCIVKNCKSFWNPNTNISFYRFPFNENELLKEWIDSVPAKRNVTKSSYVCSEHFTPDNYELRGRNIYLKKNAVPNQFNIDCDSREPHTSSLKPKLSSSEKEERLRRKVKILQDRLRRRDAKLSNVETLLKDLKNQGDGSEQLERELLKKFTGFNLEMFRNEANNSARPRSRRRYTKKMLDFASTIYFYSPKAYNYLRTKLNLPHESTLRKM